MLLSIALLTEGNQTEMAVISGHIHFFANLDERLRTQAVGNQVLDTDDLQIPFLSQFQQLRQSRHGAVFVHDFHQGTSGIETRHMA